ncbi:archaeosine synthase subunit alpha [Methanocella conradii]|uniref:archaeosine synthase subunit alpha n=1 Tax=Methanocella conradii TaxID=1175444 RepID=UPI0024B39E3C|nr:archaeosine synthase subunit alpha [Methanocella conradii]MDI6895688.1 archaeosine synthase subunit alpha [Methanocella conradii]
MTRFFEVTHRDGAARLGRILIRGGVETPYIERTHESIMVNEGNALLHEQISCAIDSVNILPYIGLPYHAPEGLINFFAPLARDKMEMEAPVGVVVHPDWHVEGADVYVMAGARAIEGDARALLDSIIKIRASSKPDTALYVPALATPENLSLLIYLGADIVDDVLTTAKAYEGLYLTQDGELSPGELFDLPCSCEVCRNNTPEGLRSMRAKERFELLAKHNYLRLEEELKRVKLHIRRGMLREYVEKQCRSRPWLTALLRLADAQYDYLEQRTPTYRSSRMLACSAESQNRVEVRRFAQRVKERFRSNGDILLIIPCSARKPYSASQSHMALASALGKYKNYVHELILTSPLGVVPRELELVYPAAHYDVAVTGVWDLEERQWVSGCLRDYLDTHSFKKVLAHVDGPYVEVCKQSGHEMVFTSRGRITSEESLLSLVEHVRAAVDELGTKPRSAKDLMLDLFRGMADYQFGAGNGELLVPEDATVKGRYPRYALFGGREQLCSISPDYGSLSLTLEGAKRMRLEPDYEVTIGDFVPKGSVLAPGIIGASLQIRPGDDVLVKGPKAIGVGKAKMSGYEMVGSTRGMAVELRHVERL